MLSLVICSGTNLAVTAEMKIGLALNILGNIDRELYAVMAQSTYFGLIHATLSIHKTQKRTSR